MKNEIIFFEDDSVKLEVNLKDETVWLNLNQLTELFDRDKSVISRHIKNSLEEELDDSVVAFFATTAKDGKTYNVEYYNLDMILSIGYRVKSKRGIAFRRWANKVLKDHLLKGYSINENRLKQLEQLVKIIDISTRIDSDAKEILNVINKYSVGLDLLDDYDHQKVSKPKGNISQKIITYKDCMNIINTLKFNEKSDIFALERDNGLEGIIGNIYQTYDKQDVYKTIEEKAANFLYLIIKNHVFIDGNKRIAATLFIYFLTFYDILFKEDKYIIENNTLVSLTLLIAESKPKEKEILINLVMNFLTN